MKSPMDNVIEDVQLSSVRGQMPAKPAGGKALMRLIALLDSRGLHDLADYMIAKSSTDETLEQVLAARNRLSPAPRQLGEHEGATRELISTETAQARATEIAEQYAAAARKHGDVTGPTAATSVELAPPPSPPTATGLQWRSLGPWTVPNGQTYGSSRVNVSGRVSAIPIHPTNPARVLCGAANGGVWESFDRGASWAPRTDDAATLAVGAIAYDHTNPNLVYCGLGEGNWWSWLASISTVENSTNILAIEIKRNGAPAACARTRAWV